MRLMFRWEDGLGEKCIYKKSHSSRCWRKEKSQLIVDNMWQLLRKDSAGSKENRIGTAFLCCFAPGMCLFLIFSFFHAASRGLKGWWWIQQLKKVENSWKVDFISRQFFIEFTIRPLDSELTTFSGWCNTSAKRWRKEMRVSIWSRHILRSFLATL